MKDFTKEWIDKMMWSLRTTEVTSQSGDMTFDEGTYCFRLAGRMVTKSGGKVIFVGNGGSASIASHMVVDFGLAGWRCVSLNDAAALTSHANDFGIEAMFSKQLELQVGEAPDILIALSGKGKSSNILSAIKFARTKGMGVVTLTGFERDNPVRKQGDVNFYVPSEQIGFVQMAHLAILHAACDFESGWEP